MPILNITAADVLKSKNIDPGWYGAKVSAVSDLKQSKAGDSVNCNVTFTIEGTEGKEIIRTYNSKAIGMIIPLFAAAQGKTTAEIKPENFQIDTDVILNKQVDVKIVLDTYEGKLNNKVEDVLPYGKGRQALPY